MVVAAVVGAFGCGQTVRVHAPPRSQLSVGEEEPVLVPEDGAVDVRVPVGYLDPRFELRSEAGEADDEGEVLESGRLPRESLSGGWAAPVVGATVCGALPLGCCGFCIANPELLAVAPLTCTSPQLAEANSNTLRTTMDSPSWLTVPTMILCAGSAGLCLALLPLTMRVTDEITLLDEDSPLPEQSSEVMLW